MIAASTTKLLLAVILVLLGTGAIGLTAGYTFNQIMASALLGIAIMSILRQNKRRPDIGLRKASKELISASIVSWIPAVITTISMQLGTVLVFGSSGANQAGIYFIAFSVLSAVTGVMYSLFTIAYPVLSGMTDGRKRLAWRMTKISLLISVPFSSSLIFYSDDIMHLLGSEYVEGAPSLEILLISVLPLAILTGINALVYSYGMYRQVLMIGLASSIPRTILYFALVPYYGSLGAAISFTIGSIAGLAVVVVIANKIKMRLVWKDIVLVLTIPMVLAAVLSYLRLHYIAGILVTIIATYLALLKLRTISNDDLESLSILPRRVSKPLITILTTLNKGLNRS
jgi:O-antigen/teichoic acid export membrane protein